MFGSDYKAGCPSCSSIADGFNGNAVHLANQDVMLWAVSRAPLAMIGVAGAITAERLAPNAQRVARAIGAVAMVAGVLLIARAVAVS